MVSRHAALINGVVQPLDLYRDGQYIICEDLESLDVTADCDLSFVDQSSDYYIWKWFPPTHVPKRRLQYESMPRGSCNYPDSLIMRHLSDDTLSGSAFGAPNGGFIEHESNRIRMTYKTAISNNLQRLRKRVLSVTLREYANGTNLLDTIRKLGLAWIPDGFGNVVYVPLTFEYEVYTLQFHRILRDAGFEVMYESIGPMQDPILIESAHVLDGARSTSIAFALGNPKLDLIARRLGVNWSDIESYPDDRHEAYRMLTSTCNRDLPAEDGIELIRCLVVGEVPRKYRYLYRMCGLTGVVCCQRIGMYVRFDLSNEISIDNPVNVTLDDLTRNSDWTIYIMPGSQYPVHM